MSDIKIYKIGVISDTHGDLDERVLAFLKDTDEVWHAGDIGDISVLDKLQSVKKTRAVFGNIDNALIRKELPEFNRFQIEGIDVLITHIAGKPGNYSKQLQKELDENGSPNILVCGHSHIALVKFDEVNNMLWMNPGACGYKGFHKIRTMLRFDIVQGKPRNMELIELGKR